MSTAIQYSESTDYIETVLVDNLCKEIYQLCSYIIFNPDVTDKISAFNNLLQKTNMHYLVYYFAGNYLKGLNDLDGAMRCYQSCISKYPLVDAFLNMAIIFQQVGKNAETKQVIDIAYKQHPEDLRILNFLGAIYYVDKDYYKAIEHYQAIISKDQKKNSSLKNIYNNLGFSCSAIGKCTKALNYFEDGLKIQIENPNTDESNLNVQLLQNKLINFDYMLENPPDVFSEFLRINDYMKPNTEYKPKNIFSGKIKVGYISPDLRQHVCSNFFDSIFKLYNRNKFEVYCYANVQFEDAESEKIKSLPEIKWFNVFNLSKQPEKICELIQSHNIDILIDLAGHTNGNLLNVLARKPAPIQMTYLGYPNTTGLVNVDYRITDKFADPIESTQKYSEKLIYLPRCFLCYTTDTPLSKIPVVPTKHSTITFGVFNKLNKHNKHTFNAWKEILEKVPNSVLLIKRDIKSAFDIRCKYLKKIGVSDDRIKIIDFISNRYEYCELYNSVDICLDTFPYSGTTTSCDSLLMSTPIITYAIPNRHVSNVTKSLLFNMGYPELVAYSYEDYVKLAVELANNPDKIIEYKNNIRDKFFSVMNPPKFVNEYDTLIEETYKQHFN